MSIVISVENVSKAYRLGMIGGVTLKADFARWLAAVRGRPNPLLKVGEERDARGIGEQFWALRNVSSEVRDGEVLGIIGRNGAGKSTLLKILSQVTAPTTGRVRVKGRIGSLLEVGTGFHPELTGRENIFLNGAILGMTKAEIRRKLDEIIAFSEIEQFIDTPVKRYSSGMYVRLGFAVAAHLEPEILIVDEVLAVGDLAFQQKCLGKMGNVAVEGRTVLFVSHNLGAVKTLCRSALWLVNGRVVMAGSSTEVVAAYMASFGSHAGVNVEERTDRKGNGRFQFTRIQFVDGQHRVVDQITSGDELTIRLDYKTTGPVDETRMIIIMNFQDDEDRTVVKFCSDEIGPVFNPFQPTGTVEISVPRFLVRAGSYTVSVFARNGTEFFEDLYDGVHHAASLNVIAGDVWKSGCASRPGSHALIPASIHN